MQATKAIMDLHNLLVTPKEEKKKYCLPGELVDFEKSGQIRKGSWRDEVFNSALQKITQTRSKESHFIPIVKRIENRGLQYIKLSGVKFDENKPLK